MSNHSSLATQTSPFYVTGGTLSSVALSYVVRNADEDLFKGLVDGQFCYVLTSRQMGKSSLMVRTAVRLREAGVGVVLLDLTAIGQNLSAEQWYGGLLTQAGQQLDLEDELEHFWDNHGKLGPLQRWMLAIRQTLMQRYPGPLVIFVDEIDAVRSVPFSTDEFFAAIREFYNRRTEDTELRRLTFCLLGVATPSDLIRDTRTTPFNIGQRIELHDFTATEAAPLAAGFPQSDEASRRLLDRVLFWTNGHPYLTQRLCQSVADDSSAAGPEEVDRVCEQLFLSYQARERDDNLIFVRERMIRSEVPLADVLTLYRRIHLGQRVPDDSSSPLVTILRLTGVTRPENGELRVRNRIYARVFGTEWIRETMPDAELRRQREAYRKGLFRAAVVAAGIIAVIGVLAFAAITQATRASAEARRADENFQRANHNAEEAGRNQVESERQKQIAEEKKTEAELQRQEAINQRSLAEDQRGLAEIQRDRAAGQEQSNRGLLYSAHMNLASRDWRDSNIEHMRALLSLHRPRPGEADPRGFDWYLLWALAHPDRQTLHFSGALQSFVFSPDLGKFAVAEANDVKLWDMSTGKQLISLKETGMRGVVEFSPDGKLLAADSDDGSIRIWDIAARRELYRLRGHTQRVLSVFFSRDGQLLASAGEDQTARVWNMRSGNLIATLNGHSKAVNSCTFSPDSRRVVTGSDDETARVWDIATGKELLTLKEHPAKGPSVPPSILKTVFSPDGRRILAIGNYMRVAIWDAVTGEVLPALGGHTSVPSSIVFSPDGKLMATGSLDRTILLWQVGTGTIIKSLIGHGNQIVEMAFSPDSKTLASASLDMTVKLWDVNGIPNPFSHQSGSHVAYSPSGRTVASAVGREIKVWDATAWKVSAVWQSETGQARAIAYSPDGLTVALGSADKTTRLWDASNGTERLILRGHTEEVSSVAFSPKGTLLATASYDKTARLWDVTTGQEYARLGHEAVVHGVTFSPDGRLLASASEDTKVRLWDVKTHRESGVLGGHTSSVRGVAFSPDGRLLASSSDDGTIKLWGVATHREVATLKGHAGSVRPIAFSPDGKRLASAGEDFSLRLWDIKTGQELVALQRGNSASAWTLAFSPDGKTLVSGSGFTGRFNIWRAASDQDVEARRLK